MGRSGGATGLKPSPLLKISLLSSSTFHIMTNTRSRLRCGPQSSPLSTFWPSVPFCFPPYLQFPPTPAPGRLSHPVSFLPPSSFPVSLVLPTSPLHSFLTPTALIRSPGMFWSRSRALPLACHTTCLWCSMCSSSLTSWNIPSASVASSTLPFRWGSWGYKGGGKIFVLSRGLKTRVEAPGTVPGYLESRKPSMGECNVS